jgi:hypothetical protein
MGALEWVGIDEEPLPGKTAIRMERAEREND